MFDFTRSGVSGVSQVHGLGFGHRLEAQALCSFVSDEVLPTGGAWKWPVYERALNKGDLFSHTRSVLGGRDTWLRRGLREYASAAYIEWKYYSVLSPVFHGIIGFSLFNPKERFSRVSEGGMLVIVAGEVSPPVGSGAEGSGHIVWMHLFQTASVEFAATESRARDKFASFHLSEREGVERVSVSSVEGLDISCRIEPEGERNEWKTRPLLGTDLNAFPAGHWLVNNTIPVGSSSGKLSISNELIRKLGTRGEHDACSFWAALKPEYLTAGLRPQSRFSGRQCEQVSMGSLSGSQHAIDVRWQRAPAYFEHSWGLHPLPAQGWDFFFAPLPDGAGGAVLQSYKNSKEMTRLDIWWRDPVTRKACSTGFVSGQLSVEWTEPYFDRQMGAWLPASRVLTGANDQFRIVLTNPVRHTLPFLRPQTAAVRCFFIGEQVGSALWTLYKADGSIVTAGRAERAGGEVAYARFPSLASRTRPFPVS